MIKILQIIAVMLLFSQCSSLPDPKTVFLQGITGQWQTSVDSVNWFKRLNPDVDIVQDTSVSVSANGTFIIGGVVFTFIEIEKNGVLAVYSLENSGTVQYVGIGFGLQGDVLATTPVRTVDQVVSVKIGTVLLQK